MNKRLTIQQLQQMPTYTSEKNENSNWGEIKNNSFLIRIQYRLSDHLVTVSTRAVSELGELIQPSQWFVQHQYIAQNDDHNHVTELAIELDTINHWIMDYGITRTAIELTPLGTYRWFWGAWNSNQDYQTPLEALVGLLAKLDGALEYDGER